MLCRIVEIALGREPQLPQGRAPKTLPNQPRGPMKKNASKQRKEPQPATEVDELFTAIAEKFPIGNPFGVIGIDYGPRLVRGKASGSHTVRLFVEKKIAGRSLPSIQWRGRRIEADVVAIGSSPRGSLSGL